MGEMIVEIMREKEDVSLDVEGTFRGPYPSGAPTIFIDTVARLGHSAGIIGGVGNDDFGKNLLDRMQKDGVNISQVIKSDEKSTGVAFVTYFSDGSRKFIFHMGNTPAVEAKMPAEDIFDGIKYFHIMGCSLMASKAFAKEIVKTMKLAIRRGAKISFDPNIRKELLQDDSVNQVVAEVVKHTNIFMPGVEELLSITGKKDVKEAILQCFENEKLEILTLKNGSQGCTVYTRGETLQVGVYPIIQKDATGAGDSFDGAFISGLLEGKSLLDTTKMAAAAGALNAAEFGPMEGKINQETIQRIINENA
nr:sugar kinase [Aequitasia blattaphilus]